MSEHDQIGRDLAKHAGDRASEAMLDAINLCDSQAQASMVAFQLLGIVAAQACGVITKHLGVNIEDMTSADMLDLMADMMREGRNPPGRTALQQSGGPDA